MANSISGVFGWAILFAVAVPVLAIFIQEVPLRGGPEAGPQGAAATVEEAVGAPQA
jgi:hypothetical protein